MYLIIGLGNPEEEYSRTRHNMGFDVINKISEVYNIPVDNRKFEAICGIGEIEEKKVILIKPQTFMNLSGESIVKFVNFYKVETQNILVIYDDIDVLTGTIKIRKKGSSGTHNGMKSVIHELNTEEFPRIRVGTGQKDKIEDLINYVLEKLDDEKYEKLEIGINKAVDATVEILKNNIDSAMNKYN